MAEREFNKVTPHLWHSQRVRALPDGAKILYVYLLTSPHTDSTGCYRLPEGYACADNGIDSGAYQSRMKILVDAGLIDVDCGYVLIERWFKHNPVINPSHATGTRRRIEKIEGERLQEKAHANFETSELEMLAKIANKNDAPDRSDTYKGDKAHLVKALDRGRRVPGHRV